MEGGGKEGLREEEKEGGRRNEEGKEQITQVRQGKGACTEQYAHV